MRRFAVMATLCFWALPAWAGDPLDGIDIAPEFTDGSCERKRDFGDWTDADGDGEDTREEVLIAESLVPVTRNSKGMIDGGLWVGPFTAFVTRCPCFLDIDHMVPVCEAYESGAHAWGQARRKDYYNSLQSAGHLIAVWSSANRSKGKRDPAEWLPPNRSYWCTYLQDWIAVKREWNLSVDPPEADTIRTGLRVCDEYEKGDHISGRHE